jgi:hypothetical protein
VCMVCGMTVQRIVARTSELDSSRPQARRAVQLAREAGLTAAHIAAIQATGISDAGKALLVQTGTGKNTVEVRRLAAEAKAALGGYFREFTFARKITTSWTDCGHESLRVGRVLDPFSGTGSTGVAATEAGVGYIGVDLDAASHAVARSRGISSMEIGPAAERHGPAGRRTVGGRTVRCAGSGASAAP